MHKIIAIAVFAVLAAVPARAQAIDSTYTKHDFEKCKLVSNEEPVTERRREGYAGIPVFWVNEPDSSTLGFGTEGAIDDTYDERFTFAVVGNTIEWRGPRKAGRIEPFAAIVRFQLCRSIGGPCRPLRASMPRARCKRACAGADRQLRAPLPLRQGSTPDSGIALNASRACSRSCPRSARRYPARRIS